MNLKNSVDRDMFPILTEHIAYLSGAIHDGCLVKRMGIKRYDIQFYQKNREWLEKSIIPRLKTFGIQTPIRGPWKNSYYLKFGNKRLYKTLEEHKDMLPEDPEMQRMFIRGFWDTEGSCPHVEKYLNGERKRSKIPPQIGFHQNGDDKLLKQVRNALINFGIECSKISGPLDRPVNKKPEFRFFIYSVNRIRKFSEIIKPEHPDKAKRLCLLFGSVNPSNRIL